MYDLDRSLDYPLCRFDSKYKPHVFDRAEESAQQLPGGGFALIRVCQRCETVVTVTLSATFEVLGTSERPPPPYRVPSRRLPSIPLTEEST